MLEMLNIARGRVDEEIFGADKVSDEFKVGFGAGHVQCLGNPPGCEDTPADSLRG
jgi:hypothetical protein